MGKVVFTSGEEVLNERSQNDDCVGCLEGILAKAKQGEITGICVAIQYADKSTGTAVGGFIWNTPLIGCLMRMVHKLSSE